MIRCPCTRGLQHNRGVRVLSPQVSPHESTSVKEEVEVAVTDRRGRGGRAKRRGGRANFQNKRSKPSDIDKIEVYNIEELPEGCGLETPLSSKRLRRQPSNPAPSQPQQQLPSVTSPKTSVTSPSKSEAQASPSVVPPSPCSMPSPAKFTKIRVTESLSASPMQHLSPSTPRPSRHLRDNLVNHGSDDDSGDSDDEIGGVIPPIPRVFRSMMETPLDYEDAAEDPASTVEIEPVCDIEPDDVLSMMTEKPRDMFEFEWRDFPNPPIPPESRREIFSEINVGPTTPFTDPYDIFIEIWDRQIMEHIASETNRYAQQLVLQMQENNNLSPRSRICNWRDTTPDELYVYFGLILAMGVVVKSRLDEYWGTTLDIFYTPGFRTYMSIDRFLLLGKCLHFNNNHNMHALGLKYSEARLYKIQPILSHLNKKFQQMYRPAQNIALDESLLMWKGCLDTVQLIPNKIANRGIKTYEICESQTGYLWRFEVHAHKKISPQRDVDPLETSTSAIVLQLIQGLEYKGYTLWMDSYYQSPCLARRLKCLGFDCVGILRTERKFVPHVLKCVAKQNLRPGQIAGLTSGDVDVMVWRDNANVAMISTYHGNGQQTVRGNTKPILIFDYNIIMGGVDKKDQLLAMYPIERKRIQVWYKKLFRRLLNVSVLNSFVIHRHSSSLSHRNFRLQLIKSLLLKHSASPSILPATIPQKVDVTHRLAEFPMGKHQRMRRACTVCKKSVRTFCVGCNKTTCMKPCFVTIHS